VCTCRNRARGTKQIELGHCTALEVEHSKTARAQQIELRIPSNATLHRHARRRGATKQSCFQLDALTWAAAALYLERENWQVNCLGKK